MRWDNRLHVGVNFIHERGWLVRLRHTSLVQRFLETAIVDFEDAVYNASDVGVAYEFADKRGLTGVDVRNVFDGSTHSWTHSSLNCRR